MKNLIYILTLFLSVNVIGQSNLYWKNKKPFADYWQQDVQYDIKATIDETKLLIKGKSELVYTNNSPHELNEVFFHLYQNAFQEGAHYHNLQVSSGRKPKYGLYEKSGLGTTIDSLFATKGVDSIILDNTILKVILSEPIKSHESVTFNIDFTTYWGNGSSRRRMKAYYVEGGNVHFNGVHWYPRIAVYDRKFGWNTNQHLDKEFYGDFGVFDVELSLANDYIVEATGSLINEEQVLPPELKEQLHISNYYHRGDKSNADTLSVPVKRIVGERKLWKFHAENVHDFAFTADPTYRLDEREWNGKKTIAVVEERHSPKWKTAAEFAMDVIKVYSKDFGMYEYPKMVVADAEDGMEYPMLTLDTGKDPYYKGLFAHEIAHNWFYGMVGTNETYRAFMDEGFTQFLTVWSLEKVDGLIYSPYNQKGKSWYKNKFKEGPKARDVRCYLGYYISAIKGEDPPLNTHSSDFNGGSVRHGGGYGQVYSKTGVMLFNLQYVLGDSLFLASMQNYVDEWKFAHPYPEDFRASIINFTKVDLNWFFDQWLETSKSIDYKFGKVRKVSKDSFEINFKRIGGMQMPLDFVVINKEDSIQSYHIPNTWFVKETDSKVLPKWYGWGNLNSTYKTTVYVPGGIADVVIDTTNRLADINPLNNSKQFPLEVEYDAQVRKFYDRYKYKMKIKPDVWWNSYDGVKLGVHLKSDYMGMKKKIDAKLWMNTGVFQNDYEDDVWITQYDDFSYDINYSDLLNKYAARLNVNARVALTGGVHKLNFGFKRKSKNKKNEIGVFAKSIFRSRGNQFNYALYQDSWKIRQVNNTFNTYLKHSYKVGRAKGRVSLNYRSSAFFSDYDYDRLTIENKLRGKLSRFNIKSRLFVQLGSGGNWAPESMLFLAGANPEELNENKFTQAEGVFNRSQTGFGDNINTFHYGGGLNLRGYSGYYAPEIIDGTTYAAYNGTSGAAINIEIEFDKWLGLNDSRKLRQWVSFKTYSFMDAGIINVYQVGKLDFAQPRADAGLGGAVKFKKFYHLETVKPVTIRLDFPLLLSRTPNVNPETYSYKWIIGINRAF